MRIFLIGLPGSGKTTFGQQLAEESGLPFIDTDQLVEKNTGKTIPAIFAEEGEYRFRQLEKETVAAGFPESCIVATGGGLPCFYNNMEVMKRSGSTVWLAPPVGILAKRISKQNGTRPLEKGIEISVIEASLREKLRHRSKFYAQADVLLESTEGVTYKKLLDLLR